MIHADDLAGKVAVVTGSSSGIGRALAVALAGEGMGVVVNGRAAERLEAVTTEIEQSGAEVLAVEADLSYPEGARLLVDRTVATFGGVDVLVNCAGGAYNAEAEDIVPKGWHRVVDVNLTSAFLVSTAAFPHLKERRPEQHRQHRLHRRRRTRARPPALLGGQGWCPPHDQGAGLRVGAARHTDQLRSPRRHRDSEVGLQWQG